MRIHVTERAELDIRLAAVYIAKTDTETALQFLGKVRTAIQRVAEFPEMGAEGVAIGGLSTPRFVVISKTKFLLFYQIRGHNILVVRRVLHGARDLRNIFEHGEV